ncbi:hypothetical protein DSN65_09660 [Pediococcus acidilactici]|nr:hypothetical protein DSN65_09660 [Pediococcus acidilactici]
MTYAWIEYSSHFLLSGKNGFWRTFGFIKVHAKNVFREFSILEKHFLFSSQSQSLLGMFFAAEPKRTFGPHFLRLIK